jgi:hypothetical protein
MTPTLHFRVIYENNVTPTLTLPLEGGGLGWGGSFLGDV